MDVLNSDSRSHLDVSPGDNGPESNDPSSAVTVCSVESSFVHDTIFPSDDTPISDGTNPSSLFGSKAPGTMNISSC